MASYPHGILAVRFSASQLGKLSVTLSLSRSQWVLSQTASVNNGAGGHSVSLSANSGQSSGAISFWSEARIVSSGGAYRRTLLLVISTTDCYRHRHF